MANNTANQLFALFQQYLHTNPQALQPNTNLGDNTTQLFSAFQQYLQANPQFVNQFQQTQHPAPSSTTPPNSTTYTPNPTHDRQQPQTQSPQTQSQFNKQSHQFNNFQSFKSEPFQAQFQQAFQQPFHQQFQQNSFQPLQQQYHQLFEQKYQQPPLQQFYQPFSGSHRNFTIPSQPNPFQASPQPHFQNSPKTKSSSSLQTLGAYVKPHIDSAIKHQVIESFLVGTSEQKVKLLLLELQQRHSQIIIDLVRAPYIHNI